MEILSKLKNDTLFSVEKLTVDRRYIKDLEFKRDDALERSLNTVDSTGINQLTRLFNKLELETICNDYLQVEHKSGNNPHSKVVLTKRLGESLEREGLEKWFKKCKDADILRTFAAALAIAGVPKDDERAMAYIQKEAPVVIRRFGFQVILNRLETADLHDICRDMKLKNHTKTNNRKALIAAIITQDNVVIPEPVVQRTLTKKPVKKSIEKCTEYEQLFQHYFLDQLVDWCRENGLKTSGSKKVVINRILAYLGGDKENTMADETRIRRSIKRRSAAPEDEDDDEEGEEEQEEEEEEEEVEVKPKKGLSDRTKNAKKEVKKTVAKKNTKPAPKKATKKVEEVEEEDQEEEGQEEEEEQEEMTVDAERELRTTDTQEDEEEEQEEEVNESNDSNASDEQEEGIDGITFCLTGHMSAKRDVIVKAIVAAGGKVAGTVTKEVQVLVAEDPDSKSAKLEKARKDGVKVVGEDYLKKFVEY